MLMRVLDRPKLCGTASAGVHELPSYRVSQYFPAAARACSVVSVAK